MDNEGTRPAAGSSLRLWGSASKVWIFDAVLVCVALLLWFFVVRRLPQTWVKLHMPLLLLAAFFCISESWRVYFHFGRSAHSFSLSEITLVLALFFSTPDELVAARLIGAAVGLGLIRRHAPIKLVFNLALWSVEAGVLTTLFAALSRAHMADDPVGWLLVLMITALVSMLGFVLSAIVISLAEGRFTRRQWLHNGAVVLVGGLASASLGLECVAALVRDPSEVWLLILPIAALSAAYALYTREYQKRHQMQSLYESSELLQRATVEKSAMPELLAQLCQVFRAETAGVTLLPLATGGDMAVTTMLSRGTISQQKSSLSFDFLQSFMPLLDERQRGLVATKQRQSPAQAWLAERGVSDAVATVLRGDDALLGAIFVGNQLGDVSSFGADDLTLLETFAAQTSVAVQNARLDLRLKHQAFHDPLTNLANRALFTDRLEHALMRRERYQDAIAVIFLDLDDFKVINDTLGHAAGDDLLCSVGERLRSVLRPSDTAARFGGDEFAILLEDSATPLDAISVAERIVEALKTHFTVASREVAVHASIGVATQASRDVGAEELLRRADVAMYRAKLQGKGAFAVFEPAMQEVASRRLEIRTDLERAFERRELTVHYQPVVDMATRVPIGVEALVRWQHPRWGLVYPNDFIGVAEETGLIADIGLYVLEEACRQCQEWQVAYSDDSLFSVSVNVSPRQLRSRSFVNDVWQVLTRTGLRPSRLVLEITEGIMLDAPAEAGERLRALKELGVRLSMDDFGTGYSALSVLQDLPLDILKIDKAFVDHVADDPRRTAFTQAIIRLGKTLGLTLIAEGVETVQQAERLRSLGCELAQGYYFSRPVEAQRITGLLEMAAAARALRPRTSQETDDTPLLVLPLDVAGGELRWRSRRNG
jgi:diguanylate cyclase (GGDEF)-like protein